MATTDVEVIALVPLYFLGDHGRGESFLMPADVVGTHEKLKMVMRKDAVPTVDAPVEDAPLAGSTISKVRTLWDVAVEPKDYLTRWPNGPKAGLALQILELEAEEAEQVLAAAEVPLISTKSIPQE